MTASVELTMPPTIGAAIGFIRSELMPVFPEDGPETRDHGEYGHQHRPQAQDRPLRRGSLDVLMVQRAPLRETLIERRVQIYNHHDSSLDGDTE
jgi:hypothetical protein